MKRLTEAERQVMIAVGWFGSRYGLMAGMGGDRRADRESLRAFGQTWIGRYLVDWSDAYRSLISEGLLRESEGAYALTEEGERARKALEVDTPLWLYEYDNFFADAEASRAHALFCERVYGKNLCQHGLADVFELGLLLDALKLSSEERALDLGCGSGRITEYLQERSGASFEGVDISEEAIGSARRRTASKRGRLTFGVGNMNRLDLAPRTFDAVVSIDTLYYVESLEETLKQMMAVLKPAGRMGIFFTQWINDLEEAAELLPENTSLAALLKKYDLNFTAHDLTAREAEHWRRKVEVLDELRPEFEREGSLRLHEYRRSEAARYAGWDLRKRSRHLYHVRT